MVSAAAAPPPLSSFFLVTLKMQSPFFFLSLYKIRLQGFDPGHNFPISIADVIADTFRSVLCGFCCCCSFFLEISFFLSFSSLLISSGSYYILPSIGLKVIHSISIILVMALIFLIEI